MADKHTLEELNNCSREELITMVLMMQGQLDTLNENIEKLIEQVRIANSYRFGKHTENSMLLTDSCHSLTKPTLCTAVPWKNLLLRISFRRERDQRKGPARYRSKGFSRRTNIAQTFRRGT